MINRRRLFGFMAGAFAAAPAIVRPSVAEPDAVAGLGELHKLSALNANLGSCLDRYGVEINAAGEVTGLVPLNPEAPSVVAINADKLTGDVDAMIACGAFART